MRAWEKGQGRLTGKFNMKPQGGESNLRRIGLEGWNLERPLLQWRPLNNLAP